jgi:translation initiation factor 2 subunit 1
MAATAHEPHFFYANRLPAADELVVVEISKIQDAAVYATLPAYGDAEGMIPITEINIRRYKRVTDYVRLGQTVVAQVLAVEEETGKIDLSLKAVREEEKQTALARYHRDSRVNNIVRSAAGENQELHDRIYSEFIWPQDEEITEWLERVRVGELTAAGDGIPAEFVAAVMMRYPMPSYTEATDVTVRFGVFHDGVERLNAFLRVLAARPGIQVVVTAPPKYRVTATAPTKTQAAALLAEAVATVPAVC